MPVKRKLRAREHEADIVVRDGKVIKNRFGPSGVVIRGVLPDGCWRLVDLEAGEC